MLKDFIELLKEENNIWIIIPALLFAGLFNLKNVHEFFDSFSSKKQTKIEYLLKENLVNEKIKLVLQEQLDSIVFRYVTGIKTNKYLREQIIKLYDLANGRLTYLDFKNASRFLTIDEDGKIKVKQVKKIEQLEYFLYWSVSFFFLFMSFLLLMLILFVEISNLRLQIAILFYVILFFTLSLVIVTQTFPLLAAKKIKNEIYKHPYIYLSKYKELKYSDSRTILSEKDKQEARKRFESHFGEIDLGHPIGIDNEIIDADLAKEYEGFQRLLLS